MGIPIGRILDCRGPRTVMATGSVIGTLASLLIAVAPNLLVFTCGWILAGVAMAATFHPWAFAALTRWWGPDRIRALTIVTLAGGLASAVFAPLTATLTEYLTWRTTYAVLARSSPPSPSMPMPMPCAPPGRRPRPLRPRSTARRSPAAAPSSSWLSPSPPAALPCTPSSWASFHS